MPTFFNRVNSYSTIQDNEPSSGDRYKQLGGVYFANPESTEIPERKLPVNLVNPNVWGPLAWFFLHNGAHKYPKVASPEIKERMKCFLIGLPVMLPCAVCQEEASDYIDARVKGLDRICSGRDELFSFFVDLHNAVNKRNGKPEIDRARAMHMYDSGEGLEKFLSV